MMRMKFWIIITANVFGLFYDTLSIFDGGHYGLPKSLPVGIIFQVCRKSSSNSTIFCGALFGLFIYLQRVEYKYRLFEWYRSGKNRSNWFFGSQYNLAFHHFHFSGLVQTPRFSVLALDKYLYLGLAIFGAGLLWVRSGRTLGFGQKS
jgi:hypothetical protein